MSWFSLVDISFSGHALRKERLKARMLSFNKEIWGANLTLVSYISLHLYLGSCLHFNLHCNVMLCNLVSEYMFCFCNLVTVAFETVENWKRGPSWELMDPCVSFPKLRLSLALMMLLFYWPLSRLFLLTLLLYRKIKLGRLFIFQISNYWNYLKQILFRFLSTQLDRLQYMGFLNCSGLE